MKNGMCTFLACMTLTLTMQSTFAQAIVKDGMTAKTPATLINVLEDYEVGVSKNPELTSEFAAELKTKVSAQVAGKTKLQLQGEMDAVINQIPDLSKRQVLKSQLQFATKEDIAKMMQNPTILGQAVTGEGANFFTGTGADPVITVLTIALVALVVAAIIHDVNHEEYYSYALYFPSYDGYCEDGSTFLYGYEQDDMIDDAYYKCETRAKNPQSCKFVGFTEYYTGYECKYTAKVEADK